VIENLHAFNPQLSDLWALGVILCIMLTGLCPVEVASPLDPRYRMIRAGLLSSMLEQWGLDVSPDAVDLLSNLLQANPNNRLSTEAIINHPWLQGLPSTPLPTTPNTRGNTPRRYSSTESSPGRDREAGEKVAGGGSGRSINVTSGGIASGSGPRDGSNTHRSNRSSGTNTGCTSRESSSADPSPRSPAPYCKVGGLCP
jgi:serine/threonine protein kinase